MKSWWGIDTDQNVSVRSLNLLIFAVEWALCGRQQPGHEWRVNDATAVAFSVECVNPFKLCPLSGNIFKEQFASYFLFIHKHLINIGRQR